MSEFVVNRPPRSAWIEAAAGIAALATLLTAAGAFDTDDLSVPHRLTLWALVSALVVGQTCLFDAMVRRTLPLKTHAFGVAVTLSLTILAVALEVHALKYTPLLPKAPDPLMEFVLFVAPPVLGVAGVTLLGASRSNTIWRGFLGDASVAVREIAARPMIAGLLPSPRIAPIADWPSGRVRSVRANDHYLEVTTEFGARFLRARMQDALALLAGEDGAQIHRSWWIARSELAAIRRVGRDYVVDLVDGKSITIGRARVSALRALRWLE